MRKLSFKALLFNIKKAAPVLCTVGGIGSFVAATVTACRQTLKLEKTLDENAKRIEEAKARTDLDEKEHKREVGRAKRKGILDVAGLYLLPAGLTVAGTVLVGTSDILQWRANAATAAAYAALAAEYRNYVKLNKENIANTVGVEAAERIQNETERNIRIKESDGTENASDIYEVADIDTDKLYGRIFSAETSLYFVEGSPYDNLTFLRSVQMFMNDRLQAYGVVFLNEVYMALGFKVTKAGAKVGWRKRAPGDPLGDGVISFGIDSLIEGTAPDSKYTFLPERIPLRFNVDGEIIDSLPLYSED